MSLKQCQTKWFLFKGEVKMGDVIPDEIVRKNCLLCFSLAYCQDYFGKYGNGWGHKNAVWEIEKNSELLVRQQNLQGCRLSQAWEDFVQKVSTLPTEIWEKQKPLSDNFVAHTELFSLVLLACLCLWQSSNFHYQNVRLGGDSVLQITGERNRDRGAKTV